MKFIKLTLAGRKKQVFINAEKITDLMLTDYGTETMVSLQGEQNFYNVVEPPEEIFQKIKEVSVELELVEGVEVSGNSVFDIPDKLEGYIKDFDVEYKFGGHGFNSFKLTESTQNDVFIRTCYPEILDCIKASFQFMDYYLENGVWK